MSVFDPNDEETILAALATEAPGDAAGRAIHVAFAAELARLGDEIAEQIGSANAVPGPIEVSAPETVLARIVREVAPTRLAERFGEDISLNWSKKNERLP